MTSVRHGCSRQLPSSLGPVLAGDVAVSSPGAGPESPGLASLFWLRVDVSSWLSDSADRESQTIRRLSHGLDGDRGPPPTDAGLPGELLRLMLMFSLDSVRRCVQRLIRSLDADRWDVKRPRIDGRILGPVRLVTGDPPGDEVLFAAAAELALTLLASLAPWRRSAPLSLEWPPLELAFSCCCCCCCCGWW